MRFAAKLAGLALVSTCGIVSGVAVISAGAEDGGAPQEQQAPAETMGCADLAAVEPAKVEMQRLYDPETGDLTVEGEKGTYAFNVNDASCLKYDEVRTLVEDVLGVYAKTQSAECAGITKELLAMDPGLLSTRGSTIETEKGKVDVDALVRYGEEVCGGKIPGISGG